jgi:hypothetical protein
MMRKQFFLGLLLTAVAGTLGAADKPEAKPSAPAVTASTATNAEVVAYYFHGTMRCETCLKIERQAREAIERRFAVEVAEERLVFEPVNYDKPENAHYLKDYKLPCPSLVLVRQKDKQKWKLLGDTWKLIENPFQFNEYVEGEVGKLVREQKQ